MLRKLLVYAITSGLAAKLYRSYRSRGSGGIRPGDASRGTYRRG